MPQWLRANLLLAALLLVTAGLLFLSLRIARALGLPPDLQRYVMAAVAALALIVNYFVAKRVHRAITRITVGSDKSPRS
jgi:membrane protein implicated in regulation of membrane protease activity